MALNKAEKEREILEVTSSEFEEDFEPEETEFETKMPYQKTKKQHLKRYEKTGSCSKYWKAALQLINRWEKKRVNRTEAEFALANFNQLCEANGVATVDHTWLYDTFKAHEDFEIFRKKIRRQLDKNQKIISLRALC